jgi:membrane protease YdiL (CAAX protease family)
MALAAVALPVALTTVYAATTAVIGGEPWLGAAVVHTLLAAVVLVVVARQGRLSSLCSLRTVADTAPAALRARPSLMWAPTAVVAAGAALLTLASARLAPGTASQRAVAPAQIAWILWVPVVEELVFRAGIGGFMRRRGGPLWGAWFSAVAFALVHAQPTLAGLAHGAVGLPLGPFLLGLCCEALLATTGRIAPAIAFHAACNATVVIFASGDARWLDWLSILYS